MKIMAAANIILWGGFCIWFVFAIIGSFVRLETQNNFIIFLINLCDIAALVSFIIAAVASIISACIWLIVYVYKN